MNLLLVALLCHLPGLTLHSKGASEERDEGWGCLLGFRGYSISCCGASVLSLNSG